MASSQTITLLLQVRDQATPALRQVQAGTDGYRQATALLAVDIARAEAAEAARAQRLGVTVAQLRQAESALESYTQANQAASQAATQAGNSIQSSSSGATQATEQNRMAFMSLKDSIFDFTNSIIAGQNPFSALIQQAPQAIEAISSLEGGFGGLLTSLAPIAPLISVVAVGLAGLATAYAVVGNALTTDEQLLKDQAKALLDSNQLLEERAQLLQKVASSTADWQKSGAELDLRAAVASGQVSAGDAAGLRAQAQVQEQGDQILIAQNGVLNNLLEQRNALVLTGRMANEKAIQDTDRQIQQQQQAIAAQKEEIESRAATAYQVAKNEAEAADRAKAAAAAEKARKQQADLLVASMERQAALLDQQAERLGQVHDAWISLLGPIELEDQRYRDQLKSIEEAARLTGDLQRAEAARYQAALDHAEKLREATMPSGDAGAAAAYDMALGGSGSAFVPSQNAATPREVLGQIGSVTSTVLQAGSSLGSLTALDPTGISAAVVAGLQSLASLGTGGGLFGDITTLLEGAVEGLGALPDTLMTFVDSAFNDLIPRVIEASGELLSGLVDAIPSIATGIVEAIPELLSAVIGVLPDLLISIVRATVTLPYEIIFGVLSELIKPSFWIDVVGALAQALIDSVRELGSNLLSIGQNADNTGIFQSGGVPARAWEKISGFFTRGFAGNFATGTDYIPQDGWALVHQGESIVPASGKVSQDTQDRLGSGGSVINISGVIAGNFEDFARQLRDYQAMGGRI